MSDENVLELCAGLPVASFAPGDFLLEEGPASDLLYVLISGEVEVLRGDTRVADIAEPGSIFGEMSALLHSAHTASVRAIAPVTAYRLKGAAAELRSGSAFTYLVAQLLARRLVETSTYLADIKRDFAHSNDHAKVLDQALDMLIKRSVASHPLPVLPRPH